MQGEWGDELESTVTPPPDCGCTASSEQLSRPPLTRRSASGGRVERLMDGPLPLASPSPLSSQRPMRGWAPVPCPGLCCVGGVHRCAGLCGGRGWWWWAPLHLHVPLFPLSLPPPPLLHFKPPTSHSPLPSSTPPTRHSQRSHARRPTQRRQPPPHHHPQHHPTPFPRRLSLVDPAQPRSALEHDPGSAEPAVIELARPAPPFLLPCACPPPSPVPAPLPCSRCDVADTGDGRASDEPPAVLLHDAADLSLHHSHPLTHHLPPLLPSLLSASLADLLPSPAAPALIIPALHSPPPARPLLLHLHLPHLLHPRLPLSLPLSPPAPAPLLPLLPPLPSPLEAVPPS